jgi:hypothetical protein
MAGQLLLGLLSVSTHLAGDEASRFDGRWQVWYTSSQSKSYEMGFSGDRFHAVEGDQWYKEEVVIDAEADAGGHLFPGSGDNNDLPCAKTNRVRLRARLL